MCRLSEGDNRTKVDKVVFCTFLGLDGDLYDRVTPGLLAFVIVFVDVLLFSSVVSNAC